MPFEPGSTFAGYEVLSRLGRGGMATVYLAKEPGIDRMVALKVLPEQLLDEPGFGARFEHEARVVGALDHPNIVPLYRFGVAEGLPWMALRYVDGGDMAASFVAGALSREQGLSILRQVASALDHAHRKGVIHRDLKPQNILLSRGHDAYLADFGIAKLLEGTSLMRTATNSVLGTPAYMSPEQIQGHALGPASDVYALAVIAFEWLTGTRPFDAETPHALLLKQVSEPPPREPLARLPAGAALVLERGLSKSPEHRPQSATEFARSLEHALSRLEKPGARLATTPLPCVEAPSRGLRRRTLELVALLVALTGAAVLSYPYWRATVPPTSTVNAVAPTNEPETAARRSIAVLPFVDLSEHGDQGYFADGLSEELLNLLAKIPGLQVAARTSSFSFKGKEVPVADIGQALNVSTVLEGSVRKSGERVRITAKLSDVSNGFQLWSESYERRLTDIFAVQDEIASGIAEALKVKLLAVRAAANHAATPEAYERYLLGRKLAGGTTADEYRRAVEAFNLAIGSDPGYAAPYAGLAIAQVFLALEGEKGVSDQQLSDGVALAEKAIALDPQLAEGYSARGYLRGVLGGEANAALADFDRALALNPSDAVTWVRYYTLLAVAGRVPEATAAARRATELDPLIAESWRELAAFLDMSGDLIAGRRAVERALQIDPKDADAQYQLATNSLWSGHPDAALREIEACIARKYCLALQAIALHELGRKEEARRVLERLERETEHPRDIAMVYASTGDKDRAFEWLARARKQGEVLWDIRYEPWRSRLRGDPRYAALLTELKM